MSSLFIFCVSVLGVGLLFSIPALLVERLLIANGIARGNSVWLVIVSFFAALYKQLTYPEPLYWLLGVVAVMICPLVVNRYDILDTLKKGRWWWKNEDDTKKH